GRVASRFGAAWKSSHDCRAAKRSGGLVEAVQNLYGWGRQFKKGLEPRVCVGIDAHPSPDRTHYTSRVDITEVLRLLRDGTHEMYSVAAAHHIAMTESALGRPLPDSYKMFVTEFSNGAYLYQLQEVRAVGGGNETD